MRIPVRQLMTMLTVLGVLTSLLILTSDLWPGWHHRETPRLLVTSFLDGNSPNIVSNKVPPSNGVQTPFVSPQWWKNHLITTCEHLGLSFNGNVSLSRAIMEHIIVDDTYKVMYCAIPKVASTTWRRIFILLSGHASREHLISMPPDDVHHKYKKYLKHLSDYTQEEISYRTENYFKFLFVREPYERLLSAFKNKFVTKTNSSSYFKSKFGRKIIGMYRPQATMENDGEGLQFPEFVEYLLDEKKKIPMNEHWETFHNLCAPCKIKYDFVGKLESIEEDFKFILSQISQDMDLKLPSRSDLKYGLTQTRLYMTEFYMQLTGSAIARLYRMYRNDFLLFNYSIPSEIMSVLSRDIIPRSSIFK